MPRAALLRLEEIDKEYRGKSLLRGASLEIFDGERCALVGRNGCGKSTLIRMILSQDEPDDGSVVYRRGIRAVLMPQEHEFGAGLTPADAMSRSEIVCLGPESEPRALEREIPDERWRKLADSVAFPMDALGRGCDELSGGERTKIALVRALSLAADCDLLIMDEPTSHLDIPSMEWIERRVNELKCTVLMVSHDRYFMDAAAQRVLAFEDSQIRSYGGNYSDYWAKLENERRLARTAYEKQQAEINRLRDSIEEMKRRWGYDTKFKTKEKQLERIELVDAPKEEKKGASMRFPHREKSGREVMSFENVSFAWGDRPVLMDASFTIEVGEKIGLIGTNGSGKSTIAKLAMQRVSPDSGRVRIIGKTIPGYFAQEHEGLNAEHTPVEEIQGQRPEMSSDTVKGLLSAFMLGERERASKVGQLSGGERARLALLKLVLSETNLLILDEPTNYLDTQSKHAVEEALKSYGGAVLLVTHDRYLLDRVATRIFALRDGQIEQFPGNYTAFKNHRPMTVRGDRRRRYRVEKKYKDWASGQSYAPGQVLSLTPEEEERHRWAIENRAFVLEED
ncbi:MAG: ABC-F family ATP-binding cassette domain-containing protein [Euryarchaeota archaeon]|nr:ABC-F family ATP-binding cassette domain-containing protein [Euryarchaeota archaeon]